MGKVLPFVAPKGRGKRAARPIFFERSELSALLALYSTQVARGVWRDYAVDFLPGQALFSIYRHAHEAPLLTIAKQLEANGKGREFLVYQGPRRLARGQSLADVRAAVQDFAQRQV